MGRRHPELLLGIVFFCTLRSLLPGGQENAGIPLLQAYLPAGNELQGWEADGSPQEFRGDDLFQYIDGGAEVYREYGFVQVLVQDYKNLSGTRLSLELFRMESPESAYGIFSYKRGARGEPLRVGTEGEIEDYYLNFWKGPFIVTLTASQAGPQVRNQLVRLALSIAKKLPGDADPPRLTTELPQTGLIKSSVRYFRGYLGFIDSYYSLGKEAFRFREAVKGDYVTGPLLFILRCASEDEASQTFAAVQRAVAASRASRKVQEIGRSRFRALDDRGNSLSVQLAKSDILVCLETAQKDEASRLFEMVINRGH
jgi:hypothetical protein